MDDKKRLKYLQRRKKDLEDDRRYMISHWKELRDYVNPLRGRFDNLTVFQNEHPSFKKIITSTSLHARETLAAGMQSGLTSPSRDWFKLAVAEEGYSQAVAEWLDIVHNTMLRVMASSNYYEEMHSTYDELASFGNSAMIIEEDFDKVIRCQTFTVGTYCVALNAHGSVDTFFHHRWMTTRQIVDKFGYEKAPKCVKRDFDKEDYEKRYRVYCLIEPDIDSTEKRFKSSWLMDEDDGVLLSEGFFREFPVMFARWNAIPDMTYGYGPGTITLADIRQLMRMQMDRIKGVAKQVSPPLLASNSLQGQGIYTAPDAITYSGADGTSLDKAVIPLYQVPLNLGDLEKALIEIKQSIDKGFYVDLFLMLQSRGGNTQMTATEVAERRTEKMTALGPVLERLETELLTPSIVRIFSIVESSGLIPQPPAEITSGQARLKIQYVSILAQAQKMTALQPIEQLTTYVATLLQAVPELADKIDFDKAVENYHLALGTPAEIIRVQDEVDMIRKQREEMQQQSAALEQMNTAAGSLQQVAQGAEQMSNAGTIGNDTLENMLGGMTGSYGGY